MGSRVTVLHIIMAERASTQSHALPTSTQADPSLAASTFKFLVTSDNHLGYQERDSRRGDDSFTTFEECLRAARLEHEVDAILLAGDFFHDNKPSLGCLARTSSLLRSYVLGDKPISFTLLSDPKRNFPTHPVPLANFQDPNINVALPIFMIHGNHDDPVGGTSSIDILSTAGLVNYFGHTSSLDDIVVEPVLLKKGDTYIALYGLGNVRDDRLHRCFRMKKLHFVQPKTEPGKDWFKILLFHQNRGVRSGGNMKCGIYETMLAGHGMDLVIWGNEHEQQMEPSPSEGFDIIQPGSTILTSLSEHECNPKKYGVLEVRGGSYRVTGFPLRSIRPVVRRTVELWRDNPGCRTLDAVEDFLRSVVEQMIEEAEEQVSRIPDDVLKFHPNIKFPIMRLAVDFTDPDSTTFPQPNINRFGQQYMDIVVNPSELLRPIKPKQVPRVASSASATGGEAPVVPVPRLNTSDIRTKVAEVFNANARDACSLLSESEVSAAVYAFAEKGERDAIDERICELLSKCQKSVWVSMRRGESESILKPESIYEEVVRHKKEANKRYEELSRAAEEALQRSTQGNELTERLRADTELAASMDSGNFPRVGGELADGAALGLLSATAPRRAGGSGATNNGEGANDALSQVGFTFPDFSNSLSPPDASGGAATRGKRSRDELNVFDVATERDTNEVNSHPNASTVKGGGKAVKSETSAPKPARGRKPKRPVDGGVSGLPLFPSLELTRDPVPDENFLLPPVVGGGVKGASTSSSGMPDNY
ncbi:endo/exonuclease Mre11 [Trypanosoma brucei brucei TREU927]|uniref:Endo/exonuclease Mre11 n=1 Tax=Trypanosoma brucei brucei (strain 927/4 GUTat10.1) TaxID=185431 RepID=Q586P4_TRYB2|nr:endo/exonuclease Mre11 [Trypanosoma brucei brucei TREU927]AAQ15896.1 endo/exonuclease Mre11 [Trypanosoma brucei brucei TREU927]AAX80191.1 endo/exonuclease Mre11 [Trypanosoma brucei]